MNKIRVALAVLLLASLAGFAAASSDEEREEKCKGWAQEDEVAADKMEEYINDCKKQLEEEEGDKKPSEG